MTSSVLEAILYTIHDNDSWSLRANDGFCGLYKIEDYGSSAITAPDFLGNKFI